MAEMVVEDIEDYQGIVVDRAFDCIAWDPDLDVVAAVVGMQELLGEFDHLLGTFVVVVVDCRHFVGMVVAVLRASEDIGAVTLVASEPKEAGLHTFLVEEASGVGYS